MNFSEAVTEVLSIVKRPDKALVAARELNAAILFCCTNAEFARDLVEMSIPIDAASYAQNLDLTDTDLFTRFRKFKAMKAPGINGYLGQLEPDKIFTKGIELLNKFYVAGNQVNFKLCALSDTINVSYYQYPPILFGVDTFWLLDLQPYMLIDRAAAKILRTIGDDKSADRHDADFRLVYMAAINDLRTGAAS